MFLGPSIGRQNGWVPGRIGRNNTEKVENVAKRVEMEFQRQFLLDRIGPSTVIDIREHWEPSIEK